MTSVTSPLVPSTLEDLDAVPAHGNAKHAPALAGIGQWPAVALEREQRRSRARDADGDVARVEPVEHLPNLGDEREARVLVQPVGHGETQVLGLSEDAGDRERRVPDVEDGVLAGD